MQANNLQVMRNLKNVNKSLSGLTYIKNLMPSTICSMVKNPNSKLMQEVNTNDDFLVAAQKITQFCESNNKSNISSSFAELAKMIKNKYKPSAVSSVSSTSSMPILGAAARKREYVARKAAEAAAAAAAAEAEAKQKAAANAATAAAANANAATAAAANANAAAASAAEASSSNTTAQTPNTLNTIRQEVAKLESDIQGIKRILNSASAAGGKRRMTRSKRKSSTRRR